MYCSIETVNECGSTSHNDTLIYGVMEAKSQQQPKKMRRKKKGRRRYDESSDDESVDDDINVDDVPDNNDPIVEVSFFDFLFVVTKYIGTFPGNFTFHQLCAVVQERGDMDGLSTLHAWTVRAPMFSDFLSLLASVPRFQERCCVPQPNILDCEDVAREACAMLLSCHLPKNQSSVCKMGSLPYPMEALDDTNADIIRTCGQRISIEEGDAQVNIAFFTGSPFVNPFNDPLNTSILGVMQLDITTIPQLKNKDIILQYQFDNLYNLIFKAIVSTHDMAMAIGKGKAGKINNSRKRSVHGLQNGDIVASTFVHNNNSLRMSIIKNSEKKLTDSIARFLETADIKEATYNLYNDIVGIAPELGILSNTASLNKLNPNCV